jgi:hypothetical protein
LVVAFAAPLDHFACELIGIDNDSAERGEIFTYE